MYPVHRVWHLLGFAEVLTVSMLLDQASGNEMQFGDNVLLLHIFSKIAVCMVPIWYSGRNDERKSSMVFPAKNQAYLLMSRRTLLMSWIWWCQETIKVCGTDCFRLESNRLCKMRDLFLVQDCFFFFRWLCLFPSSIGTFQTNNQNAVLGIINNMFSSWWESPLQSYCILFWFFKFRFNGTVRQHDDIGRTNSILESCELLCACFICFFLSKFIHHYNSCKAWALERCWYLSDNACSSWQSATTTLHIFSKKMLCTARGIRSSSVSIKKAAAPTCCQYCQHLKMKCRDHGKFLSGRWRWVNLFVFLSNRFCDIVPVCTLISSCSPALLIPRH